MEGLEKQYDALGNEITDFKVERNPIKDLSMAYAQIHKDQGIETDEAHALRVNEMNKQKVESGEADSYTKLSYGYGKNNAEKIDGLNPHQARRKVIADSNMAKLQAELKRHRERFPQSYND